ncbi:MAG TPA: tetratricopeptide repeat protein [Salinivirgaceae bacterium]|nr:tetratricopeptide repeat protein [Salinivirgaceae bacterium]
MGSSSKANSGTIRHRSDLCFLTIFLWLISSLSVSAQNNNKSWVDSKVEFFLQHKSDSVFPFLERAFKKACTDKNYNQAYAIYRWQLHAIDKLNRLNYMPDVVQKADSLVMKQANRDQIVELERIKGRIYWRMRQFEKARRSFYILLNHSQNSLDSTTISVAYNNLGLLYTEQAMLDSAMFMFQKALEANIKMGNPEEIATTLNLMGNAYLRCNKYSEAKEYYLQALFNARKSTNSETQAKILLNLSKIFHKEGKNQEALHYIDSATGIWMQTKNNSQIASMLVEKGAIYRTMNQYGTALENYQKALEIRKRLGDKLPIAATYINIGTIYKELNMSEIAIKYYNLALEIYQELKYDQYIATTLNYLGGVYYKTGMFDRALDFYLSSFRYFEVVNDRFEQANLYINIALMYKNLGNIEQSLIHYQKALEIFQSIDDQKRVADVLGYIGNLYLTSNRFNLAEIHFNKSLQIRQKISDQTGIMFSKFDLSALAIGQGNYTQAEKHLKSLWRDYAKLPSLEFKMNVASNLVLIFEKQQKFDQALFYNKQWDAIKDSLVNIKLIEQAAEMNSRIEVEKIKLGDKNNQTSDNSDKQKTEDSNTFEKNQQIWKWIEQPAVTVGVLILIISVFILILRQRKIFGKPDRAVASESESLNVVADNDLEGLSNDTIAKALLEMYQPLILGLFREIQIDLEASKSSVQSLRVYNDTLKLLANSYEILEIHLVDKLIQNRLENQIFDLKNLVDELKSGYSLFSVSRQINIQNMVNENTIILGNPIYYKFLLMLLFDYFVAFEQNNAAIYITHQKNDKNNSIVFSSDKIYLSKNEVNEIQEYVQGGGLLSKDYKTSLNLLLCLARKGMIQLEILKYGEVGTKIIVSSPDLLAVNMIDEQKKV